MATKNYMINDKWLDLDKQNIVELQSVDGELDSLKVNGSEIVTPSGKITITENGTDIDIAQYALADVAVEGGSSDFSTAEVTIINPQFVDCVLHGPILLNGAVDIEAFASDDGTTITVVTYQSEPTMCYITDMIGDTLIPSSVSGDIENDEGTLLITGNGTITISAGE